MGKNKKVQESHKRLIHISLKQIFVLVSVLWIISLALVWFFARREDFVTDFALLNPRLKTIGVNNTDQEARRNKLFATLTPLKEDMLVYLDTEQQNVAFYVEDMNSGSWSGWQEREPFITASLLKVPVAMAVMKKVDNGDWDLQKVFKVEQRYKDDNFGEVYKLPDNADITLEKLMSEMLQNSDNTATNIIFYNLTTSERDDVYYHIGVTNPEIKEMSIPNRPLFEKVTAKDVASFYRALYNATFLTRKSSNYILELLTDTKFDTLVPKSIPEDIKVAHKIGNYFNPDPERPKNYHDCGITYLPDHPYLYCMLTNTYDAKGAEVIIRDLNEKIFTYFKTGGKKS